MQKFSLIIVLFLMILNACGSKQTAQSSRRHLTQDGFIKTGQVLEGQASWYGGFFHGRRTANGEVFNKHELTAAHKSLPFGTILQVTNPETEKTIRVRINDRGPYIGKRILDLSQAAAHKLGYMGKGVAPLVAEIVVPPPNVEELPQFAKRD
jgi:rare lipoprotein A